MNAKRTRGQLVLAILRLLADENRRITELAGITGQNATQGKKILAAMKASGTVTHTVTGEWRITPHGRDVTKTLAELEGLI